MFAARTLIFGSLISIQLLLPLAGFAQEAAATIPVVLLRRDWHTEIAIPLDKVPQPLAGAVHGMPGDDTLILGFGAKAYMPKRDADVGDAIDALAGGPGTVQLLAMHGLPGNDGKMTEILTLDLSADELDAIGAFAWQAIRKTPEGVPEEISEPIPGDRYLESNVRYGMLHNCNSWTAEALSKAGLPIDADGVLYATGLMERVRAVTTEPRNDGGI